VARSLAVKAKNGQRMTSNQVAWVYKYAEKARKDIETKNISFPCPQISLLLPLELEEFGEKHTFVLRAGRWIVEIPSERVVGKVEGDLVTIFPNPFLPGSAIRGGIKRHAKERLGVRLPELVRQEGQDEGEGHALGG
jgi:hypothetical protein